MKNFLWSGWFAIVLVVPSFLWATAQTPEILFLDGKKEAMFAEPLEEYFEQGHAKPKLLQQETSTACWRGYIGTWEVKDGELFLRQLGRERLKEKNGEYEMTMDEVPLGLVFPNEKGPIKASWYSGVIRLPRGKLLRYVHMGFGSVYEKVLYLTVKEGRIVGQREINNEKYGATRSDADMEWVALAEKPVEDDGAWVDARTLPVKRLKGTFKTRGIFVAEPDGGPARLWVPDTSVTETVDIALENVPSPLPVAQGSHVEITGTMADRSLRIEAMRELKAGETFHHRDFRAGIDDRERKGE